MSEVTQAGNAATSWRKRPVTVEAVRWTGSNADELEAFAGDNFRPVAPERGEDPDRTGEVYDRFHSTWIGVHDGHWIVKGVKGEFYSIRDDVLRETYEQARAVPDIDPANTQFVGRDGRGLVSVAMPHAVMTIPQALVHAAWLVAIADDNDAFPAYLAAVRSSS